MKKIIAQTLGRKLPFFKGKNKIIRILYSPDRNLNSGEKFITDYFGKKYEGITSNFIDWGVYFYGGLEKGLLRDAVRQKIPALTMSRVIDRQKERFSDGCGFSYVPDILNYVHDNSDSDNKPSNKNSVTLSDKEQSERLFHKKNFNTWFKGMDHLIVKRELPTWCDTSAKDQKLIN